MRQICMSGSMSGVWKRSQGRTSEAPPDERGGNRYVRPTATAPHLDSTDLRRWCRAVDHLDGPRMASLGADRVKTRTPGLQFMNFSRFSAFAAITGSAERKKS